MLMPLIDISLSKLISIKKIRVIAYFFLVFWGRLKSFWSARARAQLPAASIATLDTVLKRAHSFHEFFSNPDLLNIYYCELRNYFGRDKFPRQAFDDICGQIRKINETRPEFGQNLWLTRIENREFKFSAFGDSAGRVLNKNLWRVFWRDYCLKIQSQSFAPNSVPGENSLVDQKNQILKEIEKYNALVRDFHLSQMTSMARGLSRKEKRFLDSQFFKKATADVGFRTAVASMVSLFFALPENRQFIYLSDADLLLYFLKELRQNPRKILMAVPNCPNPLGLSGAIRLFLPDVKKLMNNLDLFPHKMINSSRGGSYPIGKSVVSEFKTSCLHPIHAIWVGIPGNDCLAGHSQFLTPARWLVSASEGSLTHVIEKDGVYQGFVRCTSVRDQSAHLYGSIEIWSPVVIKNILIENPQMMHGLTMKPFFEVWFPLFLSILPKTWRGIILSESILIDNLGIKNVITESSFYRNSIALGDAQDFTLMDRTANEIANEFLTHDVLEHYGNGVIFDASIRDAGLIRLLDAAN